MLEVYRRKLLLGLMALLILFAVVLVAALLDFRQGNALLGTGIGYQVENSVIIVLALLSMIKIVQEIIKIEH
ncbi:hypothetical protein ACFLTH_16675 [Bacteroidota bacterium]